MKIKSFSKYIIKRINCIILILIMLINVMAFIPSKSNAASYNQIIINANENNNNGISAFPESYQILLNKLVDETGHTNWKFKAFYTDIDWNEMVSTSNENACYRNTIYLYFHILDMLLQYLHCIYIPKYSFLQLDQILIHPLNS